MRGAAQVRAETVRAILAGEAIDEEVADRRLGYELRRHHVALRLTSGVAEVRGLERAATEAAVLLGPRRAARRPVGRGEPRCLVWCLRGAERGRPRGLPASRGDPRRLRRAGPWRRRLRSSHAEALQAARIAASPQRRRRRSPATRESSWRPSSRPTYPGRARSWPGSSGRSRRPTSRPSDCARRSSPSLAAGGSATRVAKELYVHQNTVAYRVKRAEELLGRRVSERPIELICALTLAAALGPAVLSD